MPDERPSLGQLIETGMAESSTGDAAPPASTSADSSPAVSAAESGTTPADPSAAAPTTPPAEAKPTPGPVPYERFQEVTRANADYKKQLEGLAWAQRVTPQQLDEMLGFYGRWGSDPVEALRSMAAELAAHPEHGARLKSLAAQQLRGNGQPKANDPEPPPDIDLGDGNVWRSAKNQAQWAEWHERNLLAKVRQEFAPIVTTHQNLTKAAQQRAQDERDTAAANQLFEEVGKLPHFAEQQKAIAAKFEERVKAPGYSDANASLELYRAYIDVITTQVLPNLSSHAQAALTQQLNDKARASTLNPGAQTPAPVAGRPKSMRESLERNFAAAGLSK